MKQATREHMQHSLRCEIDGGVYVSEAVASNMIRGAIAGWNRFPANPFERLNNRELQVSHSPRQQECVPGIRCNRSI